jgi:tetratricopeptide (TPR) repeat protein
MKQFFLCFLSVSSFLPLFCQTDNPVRAKDFYGKAKAKEEQKDYQYALQLINKAVELNDTNVWYRLEKADIQWKLNALDEAIKTVKAAIRLNPSEPESYSRAGTFYSARGMSDSSIFMYNQAIQLATIDSVKMIYLLNRGTAKEGYMDYKGSLEDLLKVLAINPNYVAGLNNISNVYIELGDTARAIVIMKRLITLVPDFVGPYVNLGLTYTEMDSLKEALAYFNKAVELSPLEPLIYNNRGFLFYKMKLYDRALVDVNKSLAMYSTNSYGYKNRARIYFALNKIEEGCADLDAARHYGFEQSYGQEVNELKKKFCK